MQSTDSPEYLVKHFKYIGKTPILIAKAWTGDPHYICKYPKEMLMPGMTYDFTVCFWFANKQGRLNKVMGFELTNGKRISLIFTGTIID
jgi:hypothetical protein